MNKQKLTYLSPETETLVIRFEESVLQGGSPKYGSNGQAGGNPGLNDDNFNYGGF